MCDPVGKRTYQLYYRTSSSQERRPKIGPHGAITLEQARDIAKRWLGKVAIGGAPSLGRTPAREAPTVSQLCDVAVWWLIDQVGT